MAEKKKAKERSPTYPVIDLREAINRTRMLFDKEGKNPVPRLLAVKDMGYKSLSGRALQILSSLYQYGLIIRERGNARISDEAFTILNAPEGSPDKAKALADCSLKPTVFQELYNEFRDELPSDDNLMWQLRQRGFAKIAAETIISCYKETIEYAKPEQKEYIAEEAPQIGQKPPLQPISTTGVVWTFPLPDEKSATLTISAQPTQKEIDLIKIILDAYKPSLEAK